jgi:hypothetical protein
LTRLIPRKFLFEGDQTDGRPRKNPRSHKSA